MSEASTESTLLLEIEARVALITLNRPKALNALNAQLLHELDAMLARLDADPEVGCVVLTGSAKASPRAPTSRKWPGRAIRRSTWTTTSASPTASPSGANR